MVSPQLSSWLVCFQAIGVASYIPLKDECANVSFYVFLCLCSILSLLHLNLYCHRFQAAIFLVHTVQSFATIHLLHLQFLLAVSTLFKAATPLSLALTISYQSQQCISTVNLPLLLIMWLNCLIYSI